MKKYLLKCHELKKNESKEAPDYNKIINTCLESANGSRNNLFRCNLCYDIMLMDLNAHGNIEYKCLVCEYNKELSELETLKTFYTQFFYIKKIINVPLANG